MGSIYAPVQIIGGASGGTTQSILGGSDGKVLERIGVWVGGWQVKAIRMWLTDSSSRLFGNPSGPYKELSFAPGERITKLSLWGNGAGKRLGWIRFETSQNQLFDHGMTDWGRKQEYPIDVASGICVGAYIGAGSDIDRMGFVFLKPILNSRLINVSYPNLALDTAGILPETLDSYKDKNTGSISRNWEFGGSREITTSSSWTLSTGLEVHSEVTVKAGIPLVAEVEGKFGWQVSVTGTYQTTSETKKTVSWKQSGTLQPGQSVDLTALVRRGTINIDYSGSVEVTLKSGALFQYPLKGRYYGVSVTSVEVVDNSTKKTVFEPKIEESAFLVMEAALEKI
ncbi:hypothetical protein O6H91_09G069900 [Diphasiastrum complanatum]|uniref:Uncharacterized protein n=1 Tax=Diphasiastrum complanatum TaxID=34168 RepID=A0ACC2CQA9_DIPCM|nr:hypothetical protein O6H91_09G069900 [Diphasiastrum complanatum]